MLKARVLFDSAKPLLGARPAPAERQPQCEAITTDQNVEWRMRNYSHFTDPRRCSRPSVVAFEEEGKTTYMCRLHGGHHALDWVLMNQSDG